MSQKPVAPGQPALFSRRAAFLLAAVGVVAFGAWLVLSAIGNEFRSGHDGGAHALSISGTGYAGLVDLLRANDPLTFVARDADTVAQAGLAILTPDIDGNWNAADLNDILYARVGRPTLLVLPKWDTLPDLSHDGWIEADGTNRTSNVAKILDSARLSSRVTVNESSAASAPLTMVRSGTTLSGPTRLRTIAGKDVISVITNPQGQIVLGVVARDVYVLADPDLIANNALADPASARAAVAVVTSLAPDDGAIVFDVTLNGFATAYSIGQLVFHPPFLGLTICLVVAALLAGIAAIPGNGIANQPLPAIAFGKRTLIDNAAALIRVARRENAAVVRYRDVIIDDAAARAHLPPRSDRAKLVEQLEKRHVGSPRLAELAGAAATARTPAAALVVARKLYLWREDVTREYS